MRAVCDRRGPAWVIAVAVALGPLALTSVASPGAAGAATVPTASASPIALWSVSQLVEQLIMVGGQFSDLSASAPMAAAGVGGFVFFGQPAAGSGPAIQSGLAALAADATSQGQVVPWMSTDEEGGPIARLANVIGGLPSPRQMAAQWTPAQVGSVMANHGGAMRSLGMTMDLAPVLDTANPNNTIAGENYRSFSEDGQTAAAYGLAYADGLSSAGIVPVVKHFPGLGHADANTDLGPATDPPLSQLETDDLIPFEQAISAGLPVVMVSHAMVPGLSGSVPASLSPATYQFLRTNLGFQGVALTDDLGAGAISAAGYSQPAAAVAAIEAGADMVMIDASAWSATVNALSQAITTGQLPLSEVQASVARILAAKVGLRSGASYAVAAEGTDGALWYRTDLTNWSSLGGQLAAAPAVAAIPQPSGLASPLFIATGTDHALWIRSLGQSWAALAPGVFTSCLDNPAAVVTGPATAPVLTVACQGGDHHLYAATVAVPSNGLPRVTGWTFLGGALGAGPAVAPVNGQITYFVTASFNHGQVWTRTPASSDFGPTAFSCLGRPAAGIAQRGITTFFGCKGTDGQLWAGPLTQGAGAQGGVAPRGGAINPGPGVGIAPDAEFMFAEASFGARSVWFRTAAADWSSLGGSVVNGVGAVGLA